MKEDEVPGTSSPAQSSRVGGTKLLSDPKEDEVPGTSSPAQNSRVGGTKLLSDPNEDEVPGTSSPAQNSRVGTHMPGRWHPPLLSCGPHKQTSSLIS